jgi:hypothetical protein
MRYVTVASKTRPHTRAPNGDIIHVNGAEVKGEHAGLQLQEQGGLQWKGWTFWILGVSR